MKQLIYKHTINDLCYIGQTKFDINKRLNQHIKNAEAGKTGHFYNAIRKYGKENITSVILEDNIIFQSSLESKDILADEREIYWIEYYDTYLGKGYNMTKGGDGVSGLVTSFECRPSS